MNSEREFLKAVNGESQNKLICGENKKNMLVETDGWREGI